MKIENLDYITPELFASEVKLHKEEIPQYSATELRLLRKIDYFNASCPAMFNMPFGEKKSKKLRRVGAKVIQRSEFVTKQEELYLNRITNPVLSTVEVGNRITNDELVFATPLFNDVLKSVDRNKSTIYRVINCEQANFLAIPREVTNYDPMYLLMKNTEFEVVSIHSGISFDCPLQLLSSPKFENLTLVTISPVIKEKVPADLPASISESIEAL